MASRFAPARPLGRPICRHCCRQLPTHLSLDGPRTGCGGGGGGGGGGASRVPRTRTPSGAVLAPTMISGSSSGSVQPSGHAAAARPEEAYATACGSSACSASAPNWCGCLGKCRMAVVARLAGGTAAHSSRR